MQKTLLTTLLLSTSLLFSASAALADDCGNRGVLDEKFCDENNDMVADSPKDPADWRDPNTLVFTYTPVEDPAVYKDGQRRGISRLQATPGPALHLPAFSY